MMKKNAHTPFWRNPNLRYGSFSTLMLCVALAALVALNLVTTTLEKKNGWRLDYSFNTVTTQSDATLQVLSDLPHPVHIYALFQKGMEDAPLMELLDRYAAASPLVTWESADVSLNPGLLTKFRGSTSDETVNNNSLIVYCETTDRWKILSPADFYSVSYDYDAGKYQLAGLQYESKITSAISYVTQDEIPRIVILQGNDELEEAGLTTLTELLSSNNFEVVFASLGDSDLTLSPSDLVMLLSPQRDFMDSELKQLTDFTAAGGSLFITCDYTDPVDSMPNYQALLRSYGFVAKNGIVVASAEESDTYYDNIRIDLIPTMQSTEATLDLVQSGSDTLLLAGSRAFETPDSSDNNLTVSVVLSSGYKAYLRDLSGGNLSLDQSGDDELGPFALSLLAQRITTAGNVSRAFVIGNSTWLTSSQIYSMTNSQEFLMTVVQRLLNAQPIDLNIMAKAAVRPQLSAASTTLGSILLVALPLSVLGAGLIVLGLRRRRH